MASGPITSWQLTGKTMETVTDIIWGELQNHCRWWLQPWNYKMLAAWKKSYDQLRQRIKKQRYYLAKIGPSHKSYGFPSTHVWIWELHCKESWRWKNGGCWTVVLEKILKSPLDCKEIQPVHPKENQSWIFIGRTDADNEIRLATWFKELTYWKRPWC